MKKVIVSLVTVVLLMLCGCEAEPQRPQKTTTATEDFSLLGMIRKTDPVSALSGEDTISKEALVPQENDESKPGNPIEKQSARRKIIRNGKLTLEVENPALGQQQITSVAESHQGFVINSEFSQFDKEASSQSVTISVRIASSQFDAALTELRAVGSRVIFENITGQDVTEEFSDLEAQLRTQKALEEQLLQIMKKTGTVSNALEVQRELTRVRTEIEKLAGRKQFLENQSALSTITILLQTPTAIIAASTSGIGSRFQRAFADGLRVAVGIILLLIRVVFALLPIYLFLVLPVQLLRKRFARRPLKPATPA